MDYPQDEPIRERLPIPAASTIDLGQGGTPLLRFEDSGSPVWLKWEGGNPTGSHKDRFQAVAIAVARDLGSRGVVTSSAGNHGAACAAYAARAGLPCIVLLSPESPGALRAQIRAYGATMATVPGQIELTVAALVERGWIPSTGADPALAGRGNPFGQEGYRAIAHEIVQQLGRPPTAVAIPAASGDTFYGIWRGFRDIHELNGAKMPTLIACQPEESAPLVMTARTGTVEPKQIAEPRSLALSARDARSGWHTSLALREGGHAVAVPEERMTSAVRQLGRMGICAEPAAALALAGLSETIAEGLIPREGDHVALVTSSGLNWTRDLDLALGPAPVVYRSPKELLAAVDDAS